MLLIAAQTLDAGAPTTNPRFKRAVNTHIFDDDDEDLPGSLEHYSHDVDTPIEQLSVNVNDQRPPQGQRGGRPLRVYLDKATWQSIPREDQEAWDNLSASSKKIILEAGSVQAANRSGSNQGKNNRNRRSAQTHIFNDDVVGDEPDQGDDKAQIEVRTHKLTPSKIDHEAEASLIMELATKKTSRDEAIKMSEEAKSHEGQSSNSKRKAFVAGRQVNVASLLSESSNVPFTGPTHEPVYEREDRYCSYSHEFTASDLFGGNEEAPVEIANDQETGEPNGATQDEIDYDAIFAGLADTSLQGPPDVDDDVPGVFDNDMSPEEHDRNEQEFDAIRAARGTLATGLEIYDHRNIVASPEKIEQDSLDAAKLRDILGDMNGPQEVLNDVFKNMEQQEVLDDVDPDYYEKWRNENGVAPGNAPHQEGFVDGYCPPWLETDENKAIAKKLAEDLGVPYDPYFHAPASVKAAYEAEQAALGNTHEAIEAVIPEDIGPVDERRLIFGNILSDQEFDEALDRQKCFDNIHPHLSTEELDELDERDKEVIAPDDSINSIFHKMSSTSGGKMSGKFKKVTKPERFIDRIVRTGSSKSDSNKGDDTAVEEVLQDTPPDEIASAPITDIGTHDPDCSKWLYAAMEASKPTIEDDTTVATIKTPEDIAPSTTFKKPAPIVEPDDVISSTAIKEPVWLPDQLSKIADDTTMMESDTLEIDAQISVLADTTGATISESDRQEIADILTAVPLGNDFAPTDTSICENAIEEWKEVVHSKSSGSSSKTEKGSDSNSTTEHSNSTTERVRTRGDVLASSSNSKDVLERQQLIKDQQSKKLEEQRAKQSQKNLQKKAKKESKKMRRLTPGNPNIKKALAPKGMFHQACGLISPAKYARSDSESDSSSSYKRALLSLPSGESSADNSTSDSAPGDTALVTLETKGKPKEDPDDASEHEHPPDFRQAGS
jgi:hypothetical protein